MLGRSRRSPRDDGNAAGTAGLTWLFLVTTLPTDDANARMKVMRTIESLGAAILRDGVYLLPDHAPQRQSLERLANYIRSIKGEAQLLAAPPYDPAQDVEFRRRLDRGGKFAEIFKTIESLKQGLGLVDPSAIAKVLQKQREDFEALIMIDFLGSPFQARVAAALAEADREVNALIFPEGNKGAGRVDSRKAYFRKIWTTKKPLWIDRLASAWLIRRFIDAEAEIRWLDRDAVALPAAVTFGFDGAQFANSRERVTFEELVHFFALERDGALVRVGAVIQALSTAETGVAAASNLETMLKGAQARSKSDQEFLAESEKAFDLLYDSYVEMPEQPAGAARGR